jgi:hypothetical protein
MTTVGWRVATNVPDTSMPTVALLPTSIMGQLALEVEVIANVLVTVCPRAKGEANSSNRHSFLLMCMNRYSF